jgi:hypothetical protein
MTDTNALITRLEVIAKRYALDEVKEAAARIKELEAEVSDLNECLTIAHMDGFEKGRDARATVEK